jgi:sulfite reductase beta subunit-like hemoprotein
VSEKAITREQVLRKNSRERMKEEKHPLDVLHDLPELIRKGYEDVSEEDIVRLQWYGLYHDRPKIGHFMMRIKVAGGILTPQKLRTIGEISRKFGRGFGEISTRQNIQLHWLTLKDLPEVFATLQQGGLTTVGACGDAVRNLTSCPMAGLSRDELFDVSPVVEELAAFLYGHRDYSNLPRKHKITVSACPYQCNGPEIHCQAYIGTRQTNAGGAERHGFAVRLGGGLSTVPRLSKPIGVFIEPHEVLPVVRAVLDLWKEDLKYRLSFIKARLKFMMDDLGPEEFRRRLEAQLGRRLPDCPEYPVPVGVTDHMGVQPQKQPGQSAIGFPVLGAMLTGKRMIQIADLVEEWGGDIRLTRQQNFIITGVPEARIAETLERMATIGFSLDVNRVRATSIACTGLPYCNFAVTDTRRSLLQIISHLEQTLGPEAEGLTIYLDGCPHACGKHWVGDIGLMGTTTRGPDGKAKQAYDVLLRGGMGPQAAIGKAVLRRVPAEEVKYTVERLIRAFRHEAQNGGPRTFPEFCSTQSDEELQAIVKQQPAAAKAEADGDGRVSAAER